MKLHHLFENEVPKITDPYEAYNYAYKQGKRVPELEPIVMKNPVWACSYAKDVIKGRWPEAEPIIMKDPRIVNAYLRNFPEARTPSKDVPLVLGKYAVMDVPNTITDEQVVKLIQILNPDIVISQHATYTSRLFVESTIKQKLENNELKQVTTKQLRNNKRIRTQFLKYINCFSIGDFN